MRFLKILMLLLLCLNFTCPAQEKVLERRVTIHYKDALLKDVLLGLESKFGLKFYYANNMIPLNARVSVNKKNETLSVVLKDVFKGTDIEVMEVGAILVLKKNPPKPVPSKKSSPAKPTSAVPEEEMVASLDNIPLIPAFSVSEVNSVPKVDENTFSMEELVPIQDTAKNTSQQYIAQKSRLKKRFMAKMDSLSKIGDIAAMEELEINFAAAMVKLKGRINNSAAKLKENTLPAFREKSDSTSLDVPVQVSFITPIGTNGAMSGQATNKFSLNILQGYAYGLNGVEIGGIANIEKASVQGVQFAGITNIAGGELDGAQFAGIANVNGKMVIGSQFAGIANVNGDSVSAFQAAGIANVNDGSISGSQLGGIVNVNNGSAAGFQAAGIANINKGQGRGVQMAGIANINNDQYEGVQIAGIVNRATRVRGTQIGFINIADSVTGATIGLLNFVKNGYNRFEIYGAEGLNANAAFRFGSNICHTIIAVGVRPSSNKKEVKLAYGGGLGSLVKLTPRSSLNFDVMCYHVNEGYDEYTNHLNLLNQFKMNWNLSLANHFAIFAGPVFNVMASQYPREGNQTGSDLPVNSFFNETYSEKDFNPVNVQMWLGFNAGLRF